MTTLFISDLHLDAERPEITRLFVDFLEREAAGADALYILGDLFESWIGDDDHDAPADTVCEALQRLHGRGVPCRLQRGNRDFLLGEGFAERAAVEILPDPAVVMLAGRPTLLMHGDTLCTDDVQYQKVRAQLRDPRWQEAFLSRPREERRAFAADARRQSREHQQSHAPEIGDVAPDTVEALFRCYGLDRLIHGHTHRPAIHHLEVDGRRCERIVLGDWYEQGSVLRVDRDGSADLANLPTAR